MKNPSYLLCVLAMTNMMFILTAQQYWASNYMIVVLKGEESLVYPLFVISIISASITGSITGGVITTKLGGYTNKRTFVLCFIVFLICICACLPSSFADDVILFVVCMWVIIFCLDFIEPVFTGILLNTVCAPERATASSVQIFIIFTFGLLPAPYAYGLIQELTEDSDPVTKTNLSRWGMRAITASSLIGGIALLLALLLRKSSYNASVIRMKSVLKSNNPNLTPLEVHELVMEISDIDHEVPPEGAT